MLKTYCSAVTAAFTGMVLVFLLFFQLGWMDAVTELMLFQSFILCLLQAAPQTLWRMPKKLLNAGLSSRTLLLLDTAVRLAFVLLIAYPGGILVGFLEPSPGGFLLAALFCAPVFLFSYTLIRRSFRRSEKAAAEINEKIQARK